MYRLRIPCQLWLCGNAQHCAQPCAQTSSPGLYVMAATPSKALEHTGPDASWPEFRNSQTKSVWARETAVVGLSTQHSCWGTNDPFVEKLVVIRQPRPLRRLFRRGPIIIIVPLTRTLYELNQIPIWTSEDGRFLWFLWSAMAWTTCALAPLMPIPHPYCNGRVL